jgi:ATP-dependent protease HslVU (ClpYQ) ATPase subunit
MRDKKLKEWRELLPLSEAEWQEAGQRCVEVGFSGRNVEALCRKIATEIEDVEPPEEFYRADFAQRRRILRDLSRPMPATRIREIMEAFARFEKESEAASMRKRFEERVQEIVFHLSAQKAAMGISGPEVAG